MLFVSEAVLEVSAKAVPEHAGSRVTPAHNPISGQGRETMHGRAGMVH